MKAEKKTGELIKAARKKAGLTQAELGSKLGITPAAISQFENPNSNPTFDTLEKIANALDCKISDLCERYDIVRIEPNITPEKIEIWKKRAEAEKLIHKQALGENITETEQQIISDYIKRKKDGFSQPLEYEQQQREEAAKKVPKFIALDEKGHKIKDGKPSKFTTASRSHAQTEAYDLFHSLLDENWVMTEEQEIIAVQLRDILNTYNELNDNGRKMAVKHIQELRYSDVMTDSPQDDIYFDRIKEGINNGNKLTSDEIKWWHTYLEKSVKTVGAIFESLCSMLNREGQKRAHLQIERAIEQIELLTKIPEYQKKPDTPPQE